jgi:hypothetical protein
MQVGFNYTVLSSKGSRATAGVMVIISAPPVAVADRLQLTSRKVTTFDVLSNDIGARPGRIANISSVTPSTFEARIKTVQGATLLEVVPPLNSVTTATVSTALTGDLSIIAL